MENRGEGKSEGSCEAVTAVSECFLCVLFLLWIDRQQSQEKEKEKKRREEKGKDDDEEEEKKRREWQQ